MTAVRQGRARVASRPNFAARHSSVLLGGAGILGFLSVWQIVAISGIVNPLFLPKFTSVVERMYEMFRSGEIYPHLEFSLKNFGIGVAAAILFSVPFGILMGWNRTIDRLLDPLIGALYVVPFVALTPIVILIFGIWDMSKIVMVFIAAIFPIIINTASGMKSADAELLRMAESFGASSRQQVWRVVVPGALPAIITGIRLGVYRGLIGIFVAELVASPKGLGYLVLRSSQLFDTTTMLVPVLIVSILGVLFSSILQKVENHFDSWRPRK